MKCPTCPESALAMTDRQGVEIDYCPDCRGSLARSRRTRQADRALSLSGACRIRRNGQRASTRVRRLGLPARPTPEHGPEEVVAERHLRLTPAYSPSEKTTCAPIRTTARKPRPASSH